MNEATVATAKAKKVSLPVVVVKVAKVLKKAHSKKKQLPVTIKKAKTVSPPVVIAKSKPKLKPKPHVDQASVKCLARLVLGEAGDQPELGQIAVAYVAAQYAKKVTQRSVCDEVYDSQRYSWSLFPKNRKTVLETVGEPWLNAKAIALNMLQHTVPPRKLLTYATTYLVPSDSSKEGREWIMENTYPLGACEVNHDYRIEDHVFREERVHANMRGMICPQQKPRELARLIALRATKVVANNQYE